MDDWEVSPEPTAAHHGSPIVDELKALLPNELGGAVLHKHGETGEHLIGERDEDAQAFAALRDGLNIQPEDYAFAVADGHIGDVDVQVGAMDVAGVDGSTLLNVILEIGRPQYEDTKIEQVVVDQIETTRVTVGADLGDHGPIFFMASGDVVFWVQSGDEALVGEALGTLS